MFTRRVGSAMRSFIMSSRSTPPALKAEPLTVSSIACSTVAASAHSKRFMILRSFALLRQRREDYRRRHGNLSDAHADRVVDRVGDGGGGGNLRRLGDRAGVGGT